MTLKIWFTSYIFCACCVVVLPPSWFKMLLRSAEVENVQGFNFPRFLLQFCTSQIEKIQITLGSNVAPPEAAAQKGVLQKRCSDLPRRTIITASRQLSSEQVDFSLEVTFTYQHLWISQEELP